MFYLSQIIGRPVLSRDGHTLARLKDVVAEVHAPGADEPQGDDSVLMVKGIVARTRAGRRPFYVPAEQIEQLEDQTITLKSSTLDLHSFARRDGELLLTRDLWDKQIIDLRRRKVVRVNDLILEARGDSEWVVAGADASFPGLLRRIRLAPLLTLFRKKPADTDFIAWQQMDIFRRTSVVAPGARANHSKLAGLHPVEIARITDAVSYREGAEIIGSLDDTLAADTLEEITSERQTDIVELIEAERAADIIEEMAPDDATDLLSELPEEKAGILLDEMDPDEARDVRRLMRYPVHSAGRAMTTDFICVRPDMTVQDVISANRDRFRTADQIYYMYVTASEENNELVGIITARDLLVNEPGARVEEFMLREFLTVRPGEHEREVARTMAEYNLLALPVVDRNGELLGVITVDDALDSLLPEGWKKRLPRIFS